MLPGFGLALNHRHGKIQRAAPAQLTQPRERKGGGHAQTPRHMQNYPSVTVISALWPSALQSALSVHHLVSHPEDHAEAMLASHNTGQILHSPLFQLQAHLFQSTCWKVNQASGLSLYHITYVSPLLLSRQITTPSSI